MKKEKRLLVVSFVEIPPTNDGCRNRAFNLINFYKKLGYKIDYLYYDYFHYDTREMRKYFNSQLYIVKPEVSIKSKLKDWLRQYTYKTGLYKYVHIRYTADEIYSDAVTKKALELHRKNNYDAVMAIYFGMSKVFEAFDSKVIKILDSQDRFAYRDKIYLKNGLKPEFLYTNYVQERKALSRADVVLAIQKKEEKYYKWLLKDNAKVVTVGDLIPNKQAYLVKNKEVLFVGSSNTANIEGISWFLKEVWPAVISRDSSAKLVFVGTCCNKIPDGEYSKLGVVDDLEEVYHNVRCVVNPVLFGTGLNIKSIEALGNAKPLITTMVGAKGINKKALIACSNSAEMAERIIDILHNDKEAFEYSRRAQKFVEVYNSKNESQLKKCLKQED